MLKFAWIITFLFVFLLPAQKLNAQGWLWGRGNTGNGLDGWLLATDKTGNIFAGGCSFGLAASLVFGPLVLPNPAGVEQSVLVKYAPSGNPLWVVGTQNGMVFPISIATDPAGNVYFLGAVYDATAQLGSFTITNPNAPKTQYVLAKIDPLGTVLWVKNDGSAHYYDNVVPVADISGTGGLAVDTNGNSFIVTNFSSTATTVGTTTLTNHSTGGTDDILVAKYDRLGNLVWVKSFGGNNEDDAYGITVSPGGDIYIAGVFSSPSMVFGTTTITNTSTGGGENAFIARLDATGTPVWACSSGGTGKEFAEGVSADALGNVYLVGGVSDNSIAFSGTTITNPYPGQAVLYLVKFDPSNAVSWYKTIGSPAGGDTWGYNTTSSPCGDVWVSGDMNGSEVSVDGHIVHAPAGSDGPVFIAGYNAAGIYAGAAALQSGGDDQNTVACDASGNVFLVGDYAEDTFIVANDTLAYLDTITPIMGIGGMEIFYLVKYAVTNSNDTLFSRIDTTIGCAVGSVTVTAPPGYANYLWSNGNTTQAETMTFAGNWWVLCFGSCSAQTTVDTFSITLSHADTTSRSSDTTICAAQALNLQAPGGYTTYLWNNGGTTPYITVTSGGVYTLQEMNGCALGLDTFNVTVAPLPVVSLGHDTTLCQGNLLTLHCTEPPGTSYLWNTGSTDSALIVTGGGDYSLTVSDNGCSAAAAITVQFIQSPTTLNLGPDTILCNEPSYTLISGNTAALWNTGQTGPSITVAYSGTYVASLSNECGLTTDTVKVQFLNCDLLVPDAFTPNNDGKNDYFKVQGVNTNFYNDFSLAIYNRYGQRIFYTGNIDDGWDGTLNGIPQDLGTYFYMVRYSLNGKSHILKGDLELIR